MDNSTGPNNQPSRDNNLTPPARTVDSQAEGELLLTAKGSSEKRSQNSEEGTFQRTVRRESGVFGWFFGRSVERVREEGVLNRHHTAQKNRTWAVGVVLTVVIAASLLWAIWDHYALSERLKIKIKHIEESQPAPIPPGSNVGGAVHYEEKLKYGNTRFDKSIVVERPSLIIVTALIAYDVPNGPVKEIWFSVGITVNGKQVGRDDQRERTEDKVVSSAAYSQTELTPGTNNLSVIFCDGRAARIPKKTVMSVAYTILSLATNTTKATPL